MSKRAGAVPGETREKILAAAREEFAARGFQGSSLRRICGAAGVTTGALYFFFQGKDDLFQTVLAQITEPFGRMMAAHYAAEREAPGLDASQGQEEDFAVSRQLIQLYFAHRQTWDILVHHLNHPAVQAFLDDFTETSTEHYLGLLARPGGPQPLPDRFAIHQYVHMQVDTMLSLIVHDHSQEDMIRHAKTLIRMLRAAFQALLTPEP